MSATATAPATAGAPTEEPKKGKKKLVLILAVVVLLAGAAGAYLFVLKPSGSAAEKAPEPGIVAPLDAVQVNLAGGHYLRIAISLQLTADAAEAPDGSKALDATIALFSGLDVSELAKSKEREHLKEELEKTLEEEYEGEVMGVYFTEFVTQ